MVNASAPLLLILALGLPAAADEVILKNGAILSGVVKEAGDQVILEIDFGTMTFQKSQVREIRRTEDPIKEYDQRRIKAVSAQDHFDVGLWARQKGLDTRSRDMFKQAVSLDPEHEGARKALGFEKIEGKWLAADDAMVARGFVKHRGEWLKKETVEKFKDDEKQLAVERERSATTERLAEIQREIELARLAVERERIERERQEADRYHYYRVSWMVMPCRCRTPEVHAHIHTPVPVTGPAPAAPPKELPPLPPGPAPITPRR